MRFRTCLAALAACLLAFGFGARAQEMSDREPTPEQRAEIARLQGVLDRQHPQFGDVWIKAADATLHLGKAYYFLGPDEAKEVLKEWGNPPDQSSDVLGMVFPAGATFLDDTWGAVLTYVASGHVKDDDANSTDYDGLLAQLQEGEKEENEQRTKNGFATVHVVGWAQPPSYDAKRHYVIWARNIKFGDQSENTLNYDVRILGRTGFLSVNLVTRMDRLDQTRAEAAQLASTTTFDSGHQYADFDESTDKVASFGVGGLVAAGLGLAAAKKVGLLAGLALFAKKGIAILVAAAAGLAAKFKNLFRKKPPPPAPQA